MLVALFLFAVDDNFELEALRKVDQSDRHFISTPQEIDWERISVRDAARQQRVRELLMADAVRTAKDFDSAALIMQHGNKPSDYLLAHELASIAAFKGSFGSLPALAQDRWLNSIGMPQRWGSQFDWDGNVKPVSDKGVSATDQMRRDLLLPTLAEIKEHGMKASMMDIERRIDYIQKRMDEKQWANELHKRPTIADALRVVREQGLSSTRDYIYATEALLKSRKADELLLAHELAVIAMARRHSSAPGLFATTLDAYLAAVGLPKRYASGNVSPGVKRELSVSRSAH